MRGIVAGLVFSALVAAMPLEAQERRQEQQARLQQDQLLGLTPGTSVVITVEDGGRYKVVSVGPPMLAQVDRNALAQLMLTYEDPEAFARSSGPNAQMMRNLGDAAPIAPDQIRITLVMVSGRDGGEETFLAFENGYGQALRYRAFMLRGGRAQPTDVCTVLPGLRGYEHWPYPMDQLVIAAPALVPFGEGDAPVCE